MSHKKILLKNFSSLSLLQASNYLFPIITLPYLLRILGPEKYGLLNFAAAFVSYFTMLSDFGFNLSIPREISIYRNNKKKLEEIFSSVMIIKFIFFLISFLIIFLLIILIPKFSANSEIYFLSFLVVIGQILFPVWFFQGIEKMHFTAFTTIIIRAAATASIFIFIKEQNDLSLLIFINSSAYILIGIISQIIIYKKFSIFISFQSVKAIKYYLKESYHLFISTFSIHLYTASNVFILGLIAGESAVGYFSAADKIRAAVQNIFSSISQTIYPHSASLFFESAEKGINFIKKIFKSAGGFILAACFLLFFFAEEIIYLMGGDGYSRSVVVLKIISFLPIIVFISNLSGVQAMLNLGLKKEFTKIIFASAVLSLFLSIILVPILFEIGTSISILATEITVTTLMLFSLKKNIAGRTR